MRSPLKQDQRPPANHVEPSSRLDGPARDFQLCFTRHHTLLATPSILERLRARALDLQRRAALEHIIAGISTRFINSRLQEIGLVEQAPANWPVYVNADRAYLLGHIETGAPMESGKSRYPPGWPDQRRRSQLGWAPPMKGLSMSPTSTGCPAKSTGKRLRPLVCMAGPVSTISAPTALLACWVSMR